MKSEALSFFTGTHWTAIALLIFFSFFSVLIYKVYFSKYSKDWENQKFRFFERGEEK